MIEDRIASYRIRWVDVGCDRGRFDQSKFGKVDAVDKVDKTSDRSGRQDRITR